MRHDNVLKTIRRFIAHPPINTSLYCSGKVAGYALWVWYLISLVFRAGEFSNDYLITSISLTIFVGGLILVLLALVSLGRSTRIGLPVETTRLRTGGVYQLSRNPMYVAFTMFSVAAVVYLREPVSILLAVYSTTVHHFIILGEEEFLRRRFGGAYLDYTRRVRRYL